ncbi:hypothetical protein JL101_023175 [Skermanella rosea]|uniref:response regulator n=1 Tax=Skermanella rosea TaxID=1817965 RepID=UPI001933AC64|nr:response regulator transcription factor [Skermanella rosea]UEM02845.1 hypothetical protein JL101_023175 [Skermanella rosea]
MRILVVEDHPALREMVAGHLGQRGFAVDAVATADAARGAPEAAYDALVLDSACRTATAWRSCGRSSPAPPVRSPR